MIDRRVFMMGLAALPASALAQNRRVKIGWLVFGGTVLGPIDQTLIRALEERGLVADRGSEILFRYANGESALLPTLASDLVAQNPDLLIGIGGDLVRALYDASNGRIPIVGGVSDNPVRTGLVTTLARPGKNFTGVAYLTDELPAKRIEFLHELTPSARRVAAIWSPAHLDDEMIFARRAAENLGLNFTSHQINSISDVDAALGDVTANNADSIFVIPSRLTAITVGKVASYARERKLPVVTAWREFVASGCVLSYGPSRSFEARRLADMVVKILGGAKPADIPVEQPYKFELVISLKTAKAIGLQVPESLLLRADEVTE